MSEASPKPKLYPFTLSDFFAAFGRKPGPAGGGEVLRNAFLTTFICVLAVYPVLDSQLRLQTMGSMNPILIYAILALGLNIVVGFAGLLDLGYAAFFAI